MQVDKRTSVEQSALRVEKKTRPKYESSRTEPSAGVGLSSFIGSSSSNRSAGGFTFTTNVTVFSEKAARRLLFNIVVTIILLFSRLVLSWNLKCRYFRVNEFYKCIVSRG